MQTLHFSHIAQTDPHHIGPCAVVFPHKTIESFKVCDHFINRLLPNQAWPIFLKKEGLQSSCRKAHLCAETEPQQYQIPRAVCVHRFTSVLTSQRYNWLQRLRYIYTTYVTLNTRVVYRLCKALLLALILGYTCRRHRLSEQGKHRTRCATSWSITRSTVITNCMHKGRMHCRFKYKLNRLKYKFNNAAREM